MTRRKICVVTTSRSDFGLLETLLRSVRADRNLRLQLIVSGMHLAPEFGMTVRDIESGGFHIDRRIHMLVAGNSSLSNLKSIGVGTLSFADALNELRPDVLVLLGDRFELLAPAISALMLGLPIAHIHGGELSEGAIDDTVRHAISKMAFVHFAATETYRRRIIQMGESPKRVFNFGAPGLDKLSGAPLLSRGNLQKSLRFDLGCPFAIVTFHPATLDRSSVGDQAAALLSAIEDSPLRAIFTMANADADGSRINAMFEAFCTRSPNRYLWMPHLGHRRYLSCLKFASVMIGNSSSGLTEAPSFRLPVVNIGNRQKGRIRAKNIVDVPWSRTEIGAALKKASSVRFRNSLKALRNPYARFSDGRASERIKDVLKQIDLSESERGKSFHDL